MRFNTFLSSLCFAAAESRKEAVGVGVWEGEEFWEGFNLHIVWSDQ